jgi:uncharacterized protein YbjT (DUF2867 family)
MRAPERQQVLVTGATGYVGGRLVPLLVERGYRVRVLARDRDRLEGRPWLDRVELVLGDVLDPATLPAALDGVYAAYYLIHSMGSHGNFGQRDLRAARNFAQAAAETGVARIIYLGGLGKPESELSEHLRSRQETYLVAALETSESQGQIIEIGGRDVLTYRDMMLTYARLRGLRRFIIPVPLLTPRLSSYWVHLVTPIPSTIAQPLIKGLSVEVIVTDDRARRLFPQITPMDYETAVARALASLEAGEVETSWSDALVSSQGDTRAFIFTTQDGMLIEQRQCEVDVPASVVYAEFAALGGRKGWLAFNWLWRLRGVADRLAGGVGFRRGRRHPTSLRVGDAIDFWRVEAVEPDRLVRLRAEMKVPGRAWLQFQAETLGATRTRLIQTAFFAPKGLLGLLYWYLLWPVHGFIFSQLIRKVAAGAVARIAGEHREQP